MEIKLSGHKKRDHLPKYVSRFFTDVGLMVNVRVTQGLTERRTEPYARISSHRSNLLHIDVNIA